MKKLKVGERVTNYGQLRKGDLYSIGLHGTERVVDWSPTHEPVLEAMYYRGRAKLLRIPGCTIDVWMGPDGTIYAGCQRIPALKAFKALGRALGYEVEE